MNINDIHKLTDIFDKKIKVYKECCDLILKSDTPHSEEMFLLLLGISDSLESLSILSKINKMRDCYAISRMVYETTLNVLYIASTDFKEMKTMIDYTDTKSKKSSARSISTDKETVSSIFNGNTYEIRFSKDNPIDMKGDPRNWTNQKISNRINQINKKYGDTVSRFLQLSHLNIYRTSSDIIHGTLFGMRYALGIINQKDSKFTIESMTTHEFNSIAVLLLSISQCIYSIIYSFNKEIRLGKFEEEYSLLLEEFLKTANCIFSEKV